MKISNREKGLVTVFIVVAIFIFFPNGNNSQTVKSNLKLTSKYTKVMTRYKKIHNLKETNSNNSNVIKSDIKRNIFKFSQKPITETQKKINLEKENTKLIEKKEKIEEKTIVTGPIVPKINFKINGVIMAKTGNAVVISKSPEIFVIKENTKFFNKFIFKKVNKKNVVLGYIGFDLEKIIPIEDRGF